jgi:pre-mRNA-splicing factor 18
LRERGQPIRLFGENDEAAAKRLNILETNEVETNGMRNDFKAAMDKTEQESLNEIMNSIDPEHATQQQAIHDADEKDDETVLNEIIVIKLKFYLKTFSLIMSFFYQI